MPRRGSYRATEVRTLPPAAERRGRAWLAALTYPTPDVCDSWEAAQRYHHLDLPQLTVPDLLREQGQARLRALIDAEPADEWLTERQQQITDELARRQAASSAG